MKTGCGVAARIVVITSLAVSGCATTTPPSSTGSSAPPREVPSVMVLTDCGACQVRTSVPSQILEGYSTAAAESGARIVSGKEAVVSIKEYVARDDTSRFLVGAFAGKDEIKATVSFGDKQFMVEDYYRNAWQGIEQLARKIGRMVFEQISK